MNKDNKSDCQSSNEKLFMKIYLPTKEYPDYNFIGLIMGPRGSNQRRIETKTGVKISFRGFHESQPPILINGVEVTSLQNENTTGSLYVLLVGETQDQLDMAASIIKEYLIPPADRN